MLGQNLRSWWDYCDCINFCLSLAFSCQTFQNFCRCLLSSILNYKWQRYIWEIFKTNLITIINIQQREVWCFKCKRSFHKLFFHFEFSLMFWSVSLIITFCRRLPSLLTYRWRLSRREVCDNHWRHDIRRTRGSSPFCWRRVLHFCLKLTTFCNDLTFLSWPGNPRPSAASSVVQAGPKWLGEVAWETFYLLSQKRMTDVYLRTDTFPS